MAITHSPEVLSKILDADLNNIIRKAASGKPLTPAEHARVVSRAAGCDDSVTAAKSVSELATLLGTSRRQIARWHKLGGAPRPNPDGSYDVVGWRRFVRERGLKAGSVGADADILALKARKLLAEIEDRELRVALKKGLYVLSAEVDAEWSRRFAVLKNFLYSKLTYEVPPLAAGKDAIAIQKLNQDALDNALREAATIE